MPNKKLKVIEDIANFREYLKSLEPIIDNYEILVISFDFMFKKENADMVYNIVNVMLEKIDFYYQRVFQSDEADIILVYPIVSMKKVYEMKQVISYEVRSISELKQTLKSYKVRKNDINIFLNKPLFMKQSKESEVDFNRVIEKRVLKKILGRKSDEEYVSLLDDTLHMETPINDELDLVMFASIIKKMAESKMGLLEVSKNYCVQLDDTAKLELVIFSEYSALPNLFLNRVANLGLSASKWVNNELNYHIDKLLFKYIQDNSLYLHSVNKFNICINLNLASTASLEFIELLDKLRYEYSEIGFKAITINFHSIYTSSGGIERLKLLINLLHKWGYKVIIGTVTMDELQMCNILQMNFDYIKVSWENKLLANYSSYELMFKVLLERWGADKIIMANVISFDSILLSIQYGIRLFQGDFVESLLRLS